MIGKYAPAKPSSLRLCSSTVLPAPFSASPKPMRRQQMPDVSLGSLDITPPNPAAWTWTCHHCRSTFPLAVTRRCLYDDHYFCAGVSFDRRTGRTRKHKACGSTFDYAGWTAYCEWRDEALATLQSPDTPNSANKRKGFSIYDSIKKSYIQVSLDGEMDWESDRESTSPTSPKNCEKHCHFPSECRWNPKSLKDRRDTRTVKKKRLQRAKSSTSAARSQAHLSPVSPSSPSSQVSKAQKGDVTSSKVGAPVLDFAAFKARLDKASHRHRQQQKQEQQQQSQSQDLSSQQPIEIQLPVLEFGEPVFMELDEIGMAGEEPIRHHTYKETREPIDSGGCVTTSVASPQNNEIFPDSASESISSDEGSSDDGGSGDDERNEPQSGSFRHRDLNSLSCSPRRAAANDTAARNSTDSVSRPSSLPSKSTSTLTSKKKKKTKAKEQDNDFAKDSSWKWAVGGPESRDEVAADLAGFLGISGEMLMDMLGDGNGNGNGNGNRDGKGQG